MARALRSVRLTSIHSALPFLRVFPVERSSVTWLFHNCIFCATINLTIPLNLHCSFSLILLDHCSSAESGCFHRLAQIHVALLFAHYQHSISYCIREACVL